MKKVFAYSALGLMLVSIPLSLVVGGFCMPSVFDESYYGELYEMYSRLKGTEEKKMIIIGTSSVAFGLDTELLEGKLHEADLPYTVCSFGLYGALGTKIMLDLAKDYIKKDDVVIFAPEYIEQELSLYFSCEHAWRAMDGHFEMLSKLDGDNRKTMTGNYSKFVSEKQKYLRQGIKAKTNDIYSKSSFNDKCNLVYERKFNEMDGGFDDNSLIKLDSSIFDQDFISYVNDYANYVRKQEAEIYYAFSPINAMALYERYSDEELYDFYNFIQDSFNFKVIGNINNYIMEQEWFYDSNVHLNSSGAIVRTSQLLDDIKTQFCIDTSSNIVMPEKPINVPNGEIGSGDNSLLDYFTYEQKDNGTYEIVGAKDEIFGLKEVVVPYSYNGKLISTIDKSVFNNNEVLETIIIQENISGLEDEMFKGCSNLRKIILKQPNPSKLSVGQKLLDGTNSCYIYLPDTETLVAYSNSYFWGHYGAFMRVINEK